MRSQAAGRELRTAELVDTLAAAALVAGEAMMRETGMYPPPSVYLLDEQAPQPVLGHVECRPFYRGEDAERAVALLGVLPGVLGATRLLVTWENDDMCTAFELPEPAGGYGTGFVVVDATRGGHVVRWHPYRAVAGPPMSIGSDWVSVIPEWGREARRPSARIPAPMAGLLATWRVQPIRPGAGPACAQAMQEAGYRLRMSVGD